MILTVSTSWVHVTDCSVSDESLLYEELTSPNSNAHFVNAKRKIINDRIGANAVHMHIAYEDTKHRLYDRKEHKFPRGAIFLACDLLNTHSRRCDIRFGSVASFEPDLTLAGNGRRDPWNGPYDFQGRGIDTFFAKEFGVLEIPTRGGKTTIGLFAAQRFLAHGPVLYLVTTKESQRQVIAEINDYIGCPSSTDVASEGISVLIYNTARNRSLADYVFVVADEAHRVPAETFFEVLAQCTNAWYRMGLTGTVEGRSDGKDAFIEAAIGPVIYTVPRSLLLERRLCADGKVLMARFDDSRDLEQIKRGDWHSIERHGISQNFWRNQFIVNQWAKVWDDRQTLFLVERYEQGNLLQKHIKEATDLDVAFVNGKTPKAKRQTIYEDFAAGRINVLIASKIYNDSMTFPHLEIAVNAAGGKSETATRQKLGRVLTGGEKKMLFMDVMDVHHPTLKRHAAARKRAYVKDGYKVKIIE